MNEESNNPKSERALKEESVLKFWKENKIFEKTLEKKSPKGEFVFYDGPPFATGLPHYGHILPGTIKDVIPRYKTMRGFRVPRRWGWDCHGLPIENMIEKELGLESKKDVEKFGVAEFNKRAHQSVLRYEKEWKEIIPRTGRWADMDNPYKTMDSSYTESVWWSFKNLYDKNLIYQGFKSMHLCPRCETTLSNFEVNQGYKDITDISVYVKFELINEPGTFILAWTTTPWTLPGNVALAVNPEIKYAKVKLNNESYWIAESRVAETELAGGENIEDKLGQELVGLRYKTLFNYYLSESQVYAAEFVMADEGTGIVHIAPAFGEEDYNLSLKENLPFVQHVGTDGRFKSEVTDFSGLMAKPKEDHQSTDVEIIKYLAARNLLFAKKKITHSYPHCWRCDTPLLNYAASSWFVKVTAIKEKLIENNCQVKWVPEDIRDGRFGKWLEGARDWAVSRSRFWGSPLPVWENSDGSKRIVVDSLETLKKYVKKSGNKYFLMRHGGTDGNKNETVSYQKEAGDHLTEKGKEQTRTSARQLKKSQIDLLVVSPFVRTRETAEIVRQELNLPESAVIFDERLKEINPGEFDGKNWREYHEYIYSNTGRKWFEGRIPGGESLREVGKRMGDCLYELENKYQGKNILIVTHGGSAWLSYVVAGLYQPENKEYKKADTHVFVDEFKRFENAEVRELPFLPLPHNDDFMLDLHRPYIDEVVLEKDGEEYKRVPEVFDTWYDSGSVPFASRSAKDFRPADFIAEGLDQTRGWFYTMIVLGTALFGKSPYKQVVVHGLVLAEDGKKMSKRLKNYPELDVVLEKYGADALRYYLLSSQVIRGEDLAFSEKGLDEVVKKIINRLENVLSYHQLYADKEVQKPSRSFLGFEFSSVKMHILDCWIDARLFQLIADVTAGLETYELDQATRPIADFVDDLSTWYLRRSRNRPEALAHLRFILKTLALVLAPFMPFLAEDIYLQLKNQDDKESVHLEEWPHVSPGTADTHLLQTMKEVRRVVSLALEARMKANLKVRQPLSKLEIKLDLSDEYLEIIKDELNVKEVVVNQKLETEIALDTTLTPELLEEGRVRDAIRLVQEWRKEQGLKPGESARYSVPEADLALFEKYSAEIKKATTVEF